MNPEDFLAELQEWAKSGYLRTLVKPGIAEHHAEDIAQESWLRIRKFDPAQIIDPAALRALGAVVVQRTTIDLLYRARKRFENPGPMDPHEFIELALAERHHVVDSPEDECDRERCEQLLHQALAKLPRAQRHTLELFKLEELPAAEVARRRGVTIQTVYADTRDAVRRLMKELREIYPDDRPRRGKP